MVSPSLRPFLANCFNFATDLCISHSASLHIFGNGLSKTIQSKRSKSQSTSPCPSYLIALFTTPIPFLSFLLSLHLPFPRTPPSHPPLTSTRSLIVLYHTFLTAPFVFPYAFPAPIPILSSISPSPRNHPYPFPLNPALNNPFPSPSFPFFLSYPPYHPPLHSHYKFSLNPFLLINPIYNYVCLFSYSLLFLPSSLPFPYPQPLINTFLLNCLHTPIYYSASHSLSLSFPTP